MEKLSAQVRWTPSSEKSCQTDDLCQEAAVPGPNQTSRMPVFFSEPGDPPLLQKPLETSKSGIQQIIECFRTGTAQLKHILLKEVDTIFECKLCRSLFRGLPNLITHKKLYCSPRLLEPDEDLGDGEQSLAVKERLEAVYPRAAGQDCAVRLEPIEGNQNAVFQHLVTEDKLGRTFYCGSSVGTWTPSLNVGGGEAESEVEESKGGIEEQTKGEAEVMLEEEEKKEEEEEEKRDGEMVDEQVENRLMDDMIFTCCLCGKDFNSQRSLHRHCCNMHQQRLEDLCKFSGNRTVPISLFNVVKDQQTDETRPSSSVSTTCLVCGSCVGSTPGANVCHHSDEVHRSLRRNLITPDMVTKPGQLEALPLLQEPMPKFNLSSLKCLLCMRTYNTQTRLKRHMRFVHKIRTSRTSSSSSLDGGTSKANQSSCSHLAARNLKRPREEEEEEEEDKVGSLLRKPRLSKAFDFKQLFCKLCKRQFSSLQNLNKHIVLHTDNGSDLFIKFHRCPQCSYESRRKRDVLRHITVVHKKNSTELAKELRAVKRPAEMVLGSSEKRSHAKEDVSDRRQLHVCDMCGRAFTKKVYLESHKRSHWNAANSERRTSGMSTRSKSLLGSF